MAVLCALLGVTGCASDSNGSGQPTTTASAATPTQGAVPATTDARTGNLPPPTSLASNVPAACGSGQVVVDAIIMSPGMGHRGVRLNFSIARDSQSCTLNGYPGVDTGSGGPLLHAERTLRGYMGGLPSGDDTPPTVLLDNTHGAQAIVEGVAFDSDGNQCSTYTDLRVTAPNTTDTVTVSARIDSCHLQIHPVTALQ
ncbi:DUF4232 domain-containing protein [Nocardia sp. NBC_01503]|uniref:DUF4232 domain-containing protein n=1 Tax=Nocardia sp. NBC_01503 TaxID=2975997 RepID=UPI002E7B2244|nr:DUF4232 domain-containing protein [Nocardia sp. NBC_01503]WTL31171.1 DUF4232 domain-containing protein [Nocardia sp. NBC_01503]